MRKCIHCDVEMLATDISQRALNIAEANAKMNGTIVKCLVTGLSDKDKTKVCGYTENMKLVNIDGPKELIGNIVSVKITDTKSFSMDGVYIKD